MHSMKKKKTILIEYVMKVGTIGNSLLNIFGKKENEKLIECLMKEDELCNSRKLPGNEQTVNSLLNAFGKEKNEKLIQYLKEENQKNQKLTIEGYKTIVNSMLNEFQKTNKILIDDLMKGYTVLQHVSMKNNKKEKIVKVLSQKLNDAEKQKFLCDLYEITQMFKKQKDDCKPNL